MNRWREVTINEIARVQSGSGFPKRYQGETSGDYPFFKVSDMNLPGNERFMMTANNYVSKETRVELGASVFPIGSIIFPKIGAAIATNKKRIVTQACCVDNNVMGVVPVPDEVDPDFLFFWLIQHDLSEFANDSELPSIRKTTVEAYPLTVPKSLTEQKRIVAILDEAFAAIATATANAEKNLANARELFDSERNGVLEDTTNGWIESELGELVTIKHGFAFKSEGFVELSDHVLLTPGNFFEGGGYRDRETKQKYYAGEIPSGFILSEGDLLVAMTEQAAGLLGSPLIVPESGRFLHNQRLGLVQPLPDATWCAEFFFHVFNTRSFRTKVHADASGVKVRHTSPQKMYGVRLRYPESVAAQQSVAAHISAIHDECLALASGYARTSKALSKLKQSILHKAFTGELTAGTDEAHDCTPAVADVQCG